MLLQIGFRKNIGQIKQIRCCNLFTAAFLYMEILSYSACRKSQTIGV